MATSLKAREMLTLSYGCGLRASEVARLRAGDIDSEQMIIRIVQSKGRKNRHVMLPAEILDLLRQWWKARSTRHDTGVAPEQRWLFPGRGDHQPMTTSRGRWTNSLRRALERGGLRTCLPTARPITRAGGFSVSCFACLWRGAFRLLSGLSILAIIPIATRV